MSARRKSGAATPLVPAREKRIVSSWSETQANHRGDFRTCPHCEYASTGITEWDQRASILVLNPAFYLSDAVVVVSECPECFGLSWVHTRMGYIRTHTGYPEDWEEAAREKEDRVRLAALREWGAGICHRCKHLKSGTVEFHAWRHCKRGSGPAMTACDMFAEFKPAGAQPKAASSG